MQFIEGAAVKKLKLVADSRGYLMEMLRSDWPEFMKFGQSYVTASYPGIIKAWHYHNLQWDHFVCVHGMARVVLYDSRDGSPTEGMVNEFHIAQLNSMLLKIPNLVNHGFTAEGPDTALIVNYPTELYNYDNPEEYRLPYDDPSIPYSWEVSHG